MKRRAKDFQEATANYIEQIFREGKQRRMLLADEVGLGKTIVAREVIERVRHIRSEVHDDMYRVVYVCSNQSIVNQNIENLGISEHMNVGESRLSMQHLKMQEYMSTLTGYRPDGKYEEGEMPELLIPLTPGTSFNQTMGQGIAVERAMIYDVLKCMTEFSAYQAQLSDILSFGVKSWDYYTSDIKKRINACGPGYYQKLHDLLRQSPSWEAVKNDLLELCQGESEHSRYRIVGTLRMIFAQISLEELKPDLVIMDEFQRFSSLLENNNANDEQSMITRKFFGDLDKDGPLILLLSATPYKPYTTLEELNEDACDTQYEDFNKLMDFLFRTNQEGTSFKTVWENYSRGLSHLSTKDFDVLIARKNEAEDKMYQAMCRTERFNDGLIDASGVMQVEITEGDVLSYAQMQKVLEDCRNNADKRKNIRFHSFHAPVEYIKSAPYLLSFMENYQLKKKITVMYTDAQLPLSTHRQRLLLKANDIYQYKDIPSNNARLENLKQHVFRNHSELLLWVPASHPYYKTPASNVFEKNKDFSKFLVFSAWAMVPRMIASMLSYESERRTIKTAFDNGTYTNKIGIARIKPGDDEWLTYPCDTLAGLYKPEDYFNEKIANIQSSIEEKIENLFDGIKIVKKRCSDDIVLSLMKWLDGNREETLDAIPRRAIKILANFAIGAPAICLYRVLKDKEKAEKLAQNFVTMFNRRQSAAILDVVYNHKHEDTSVYYEQVIDYCVKGNLQAVLDEYAHLLGDNIYEKMSDSFSDVSTLEVDTTSSFGKPEEKKWKMRTWFSVEYTSKKKDDDSIERADNRRAAFNSPFRPFVLSTTSIGQEGLDFHLYCRKIVHWNIPTNPQDLEQREGRINRFKCLAIRRNIAHLYPGKFTWNDMFTQAESDLKSGHQYSDIVPFWSLPRHLIAERGVEPEMIERIVPMYPMSKDVSKYKRLIQVLSLYRLTMGQPRQEELLEMLQGLIGDAQVKQLLFNLSPYDKKNNNLKPVGGIK